MGKVNSLLPLDQSLFNIWTHRHLVKNTQNSDLRSETGFRAAKLGDGMLRSGYRAARSSEGAVRSSEGPAWSGHGALLKSTKSIKIY